MTLEVGTDSTPPAARGQPPDLEFAVLGARPVKYAAAPMLTIDLEVSEPAGREVYMVALTIQLMIEPARRRNVLFMARPPGAGLPRRSARANAG